MAKQKWKVLFKENYIDVKNLLVDSLKNIFMVSNNNYKGVRTMIIVKVICYVNKENHFLTLQSKDHVRRAIKTKAPVIVQVLLTLEGGGLKSKKLLLH